MKQIKYSCLLWLAMTVLGCQFSSDTETKPETATDIPATGNGEAEDYHFTNRVVWQKPESVIGRMGDLKDKTVADIGAGTGFFALRMTPLARQVIAIDIEPRLVTYLDSLRRHTLPDTLQNRLRVQLADPANPGLRAQEADRILIVNTYMYLNDRDRYLRRLYTGLRPAGRIVVVDFKKKKTSLGPPRAIRVPQFQVEEELERAGFRILESNDTELDYQYIIVAEKKEGQ